MLPKQNYETLDPENWDEIRKLAHRMVDDSIDYLQTVRERPVWQSIPDQIANKFVSPVPNEPTEPKKVYDEFLESILPYPMGNIHPRFWAWYMGNGTVMGALAEFLAAVMNPNLGGGNHIANLVEDQVIRWMKEILDFPATSSGLLVSGGSMANLVGLTVARNIKSGFNIRERGLSESGQKMIIYASKEVHSSNQKAVELLGLGNTNFRKIQVNEDYSINITALEKAIAKDRKAGNNPICVIGNAGTINTGAIDELNTIADICKHEDIWFHIDGAIGAVAVLAKSVKPQLAGIEKADSVALDLHKWMHIPFEAGCVLVRQDEAHRKSFSLTPEYLEHGTRGLASGHIWFSDYGLQLSRQFRALKVWMSLKEHGIKRYGRMIERNIRQAHYLKEMIEREDNLEMMAPVGLDIVCFRYNPGNLSESELNELNKELLIQIQERGISAPSYTTLNEKYCLRVAIANHRSTDEDFEIFVKELLRIGRTLNYSTLIA